MSYLSRYKLLTAGISLNFFLFFTQPVFAATAPDFPSCLHPQSAAAQVNNGANHGVIGESVPYSGTDSIYSLPNEQVLQCLCTTSGAGIQTNWLRISDMSQADINDLIGQGWIYVDNGALWGLQSGPYLAKNIAYTCSSTAGTTNGTSNGISTGVAAAAATALQQGVLGLAITGNIAGIYGLILMGVITLSAGIWLSRMKRSK